LLFLLFLLLFLLFLLFTIFIIIIITDLLIYYYRIEEHFDEICVATYCTYSFSLGSLHLYIYTFSLLYFVVLLV